MRKKNGFVFMETLVVVSVLSLTLLILFASYSYILRKSRERNTFDTTETIYKTYYVKNIIDSLKPNGQTKTGLKYYIDSHLGHECKKMGSFDSYVCDFSAKDYTGDLLQVKLAFEIDKIYMLNPNKILNSNKKDDWLWEFDATTIDYINELGAGVNHDLIVIKYKKTYNKTDGTYEVIHSSMEV